MSKDNKDMIQKVRCGLEVLTVLSIAFLENTYHQMTMVFFGKSTSGTDRGAALAKGLASLVLGGLLGFAAIFTIVGPVSMLSRVSESYSANDANIAIGAYKRAFTAGKNSLGDFYKDAHKDVLFKALGMDKKGTFREIGVVASCEITADIIASGADSIIRKVDI